MFSPVDKEDLKLLYRVDTKDLKLLHRVDTNDLKVLVTLLYPGSSARVDTQMYTRMLPLSLYSYKKGNSQPIERFNMS